MRGNHDDVIIEHPNLIASCEILNLSIKDDRVENGRRHLSICHYPKLAWEKSYYGSIHIHAHEHGRLLLNTGYKEYYNENYAIDVGVNILPNNEPISYEEVIGVMELKDKNRIVGLKERI